VVGSDDICFKEDGNLWKRNEERQVGNCTREQEENSPAGNDLFVWTEKIALLEGISVKAMSSGDGQVRF